MTYKGVCHDQYQFLYQDRISLVTRAKYAHSMQVKYLYNCKISIDLNSNPNTMHNGKFLGKKRGKTMIVSSDGPEIFVWVGLNFC